MFPIRKTMCTVLSLVDIFWYCLWLSMNPFHKCITMWSSFWLENLVHKGSISFLEVEQVCLLLFFFWQSCFWLENLIHKCSISFLEVEHVFLLLFFVLKGLITIAYKTSCHILMCQPKVLHQTWKQSRSYWPLMLLVANFCLSKMIQKTFKLTETLTYWYSSERTQQDLFNEYQHDRVKMISKIVVLYALDENSLSVGRVKWVGKLICT